MIDELIVYLRDRRVGVLSQRDGRLAFFYDEEWLHAPERHPLSLSLPLREEPFADAATRTWFGNLLPEGDVLTAVARRLGRSTGDIFGLLVDLGGECAGAVSLIPPGGEHSQQGHYEQLSDDELWTLASAGSPQPLLAGEDGVRLSLAGAQNKVPVFVDATGIYKSIGALATTHILKPPIRSAIPLPQTVENEAFCMQLAKELGLIVPRAEIRAIREQNFYLVERFDRQRQGGRVVRLHQEDTCQALGIEANLKYEESGGPGLAAIWELFRKYSAAPAADARQLLRWISFNFLIGNADAHGKNLSLLYGSDGSVSLAPFYDLLCTACYPQLDLRLAMRIGRERHPDRIRRRHWERLAEDLEISPKPILQELKRLTSVIEQKSAFLADNFRKNEGGSETIDAIQKIIRQRSSWAWAVLGGRPD